MTDLRLAALAALLGAALAFLAGVRRFFARPVQPHRYSASRVSGAVLIVEGAAIAASPVPAARAAAAVAILGASVALFLWAARTNRPRPLALAFSGETSAHLQTGGPYRLVRHPFYASYVLAFLGGWVAAGTPWLAPAVAAGAFTYFRAARGEEAALLASPVGEAYREYAQAVGMFLPRFGGRR